jgi:ribulose-phosphate 3-epimerase
MAAACAMDVPIMALIAPSLLAANMARLAEALEIIKAAGASMVHVDVMDGHFVPEITVGQPVIASLRQATDLVLDVHLLIERPERYVVDFVEAGADRISVHIEATPHLHKALDLIRTRGAKAGVALNPATPIESLAEVWQEIDFVDVLAADPGLDEAAFIPASVAKVRAASQAREAQRLGFALQVEGAVTAANLEELARAGADILVMGSAIFESVSPQARLSALIRRAAEIGLTSKV